MLRIGFGRVFGQQPKFGNVAAQLRQSVDAVHHHARKPAEVIQAKVIDFQLVAIDAQNRPHIAHRRHRHIANVEHACVRTQTAHTFCHNRRRVGVVHNPGLLVGETLDKIDQLNHRQDCAQSVGQPTRPTSFLADYAVTQWDLLVLFTHFVLTHAHLGENKVRAAEGHFWIVGDGENNALAVIAYDFFNDWRNGVLARRIDIIEANFCQRKVL
ncbi:hypothetical protein D3C80_691030 [compost metagenome]